ncbi:hypothetical protein, partial [Citrobacter youngae]|uniref:hypothetical protein n=1 Tax=Citrobacter youngae TaxID=133448 RepID=UPI001C0E0010
SEVKRRSADGSVGSPHARVGNCQASIKVKKPILTDGRFCVCAGCTLPDAAQRLIRPTGGYAAN